MQSVFNGSGLIISGHCSDFEGSWSNRYVTASKKILCGPKTSYLGVLVEIYIYV